MARHKNTQLNKRALQTAVAVCGLVPVTAGLLGMLLGPDMIGDASMLGVPFDSHYRYLSGLLFGIGIAFYTLIPDIEKKGDFFRLLTAIVFIGGLARLYSLLVLGMPDKPMLFGLVMELVIVPLLALWQYKISKA